MFIIPIYLFSEIFPGVSRGPSVLAPGPIHQFGRHWWVDAADQECNIQAKCEKIGDFAVQSLSTEETLSPDTDASPCMLLFC